MSALSFTEEMKGHLALGEADPRAGQAAGRRAGDRLMFHLAITVDDVASFVADPRLEARAEGWVGCDLLGGRLPVQRGVFNLFVPTGDAAEVRMLYRLWFADAVGHPLTLSGHKVVRDDPGADLWPDTSTLYVRILAGHVEAEEEEGATVVAAGVVHILVADFARQLTTFRVTGGGPGQRLAALEAFGRVFAGQLWDTYGPLARRPAHDRREHALGAAPGEVWSLLERAAMWPSWSTAWRAPDGLAPGAGVTSWVAIGRWSWPLGLRVEDGGGERRLRLRTGGLGPLAHSRLLLEVVEAEGGAALVATVSHVGPAPLAPLTWARCLLVRAAATLAEEVAAELGPEGEDRPDPPVEDRPHPPTPRPPTLHPPTPRPPTPEVADGP